MFEEPYRVEVDNNGCERCGCGKTWTVVDLDDIACGTSWENREDAESYADDLNGAYHSGRASLTEG